MTETIPAAAELVARLRAFLVEHDTGLNARLPPERVLSDRFAVSRAQLRKALDVLEAEGRIWRHVGRGTFIGPRPVLDLAELAYLGERTSPLQIVEARLALEPALARLAARHGTAADLERLAASCRRCVDADEWRAYEAADDAFHHAVALASRNKLLINLCERLNSVRRAAVWGQRRTSRRPPRDHASFAEHAAVLEAIQRRDADGADAAMRTHLQSVTRRVHTTLEV